MSMNGLDEHAPKPFLILGSAVAGPPFLGLADILSKVDDILVQSTFDAARRKTVLASAGILSWMAGKLLQMAGILSWMAGKTFRTKK